MDRELALSSNTIRYHLRYLEKAGLVRLRKSRDARWFVHRPARPPLPRHGREGALLRSLTAVPQTAHELADRTGMTLAEVRLAALDLVVRGFCKRVWTVELPRLRYRRTQPGAVSPVPATRAPRVRLRQSQIDRIRSVDPILAASLGTAEDAPA